MSFILISAISATCELLKLRQPESANGGSLCEFLDIPSEMQRRETAFTSFRRATLARWFRFNGERPRPANSKRRCRFLFPGNGRHKILRVNWRPRVLKLQQISVKGRQPPMD